MADAKGNKSKQRQSKTSKAYYTAQFYRTQRNKLRRKARRDKRAEKRAGLAAIRRKARREQAARTGLPLNLIP